MTASVAYEPAPREPIAETLWEGIDRVYHAISGTAAPTLSPDYSAIREVPQPQPGDWNPVERLRELFGLSQFELDILLLCTGSAIDSRFTSANADGAQLSPPTFGLAAASLENPHWSATGRMRPLRYWRLIEVGTGPLMQAPLSIDERILQFLLGVPASDERLEAIMRPLSSDAKDPASMWTEELSNAARRGALHWRQAAGLRGPILLAGGRADERTELFRSLCQESGLRAWVVDSTDIPTASAERERLARAFTRECGLWPVALLIRTAYLENTRELEAWLERVDGPVAIEAAAGSAAERLNGFRIEVPSMTAAQRKGLWQHHLGPLAAQLDSDIDAIVEVFSLDAKEISQTAAAIRNEAELHPDAAQSAAWRLSRRSAQRSLDELATRVDSRSSWDSLVLPDAQTSILQQIVVNALQRARVYNQWGFADRYERGLGLSALFAGASGTGKTMAAGILAHELGRDLYQIDLATVVSKYIGETEKHLRRIFDAAERSGAILLFDEADSLFGKRSPIRDSHDRYANLEVSYLLQRMDSYRGIAILTTNSQNAMDPAFQRRLRFVVQFPFPDAVSRERIWHRVFPTAAPTEKLDYPRLAQLNVTGGVIRNIALMAAFLAADEQAHADGIAMRHVKAAARTEYAKLDKPLSPAEIMGWE
jgi:SpoVK/Ycf46/Vps4 family AAA+-type ATPase